MNEMQEQIMKVLYRSKKHTENHCFLCVSFPKKQIDETFADEVRLSEPIVSFVVDLGGIAAEWSPPAAPITRIIQCGCDHPLAVPHWYFEFVVRNQASSWLSVDQLELPHHANTGDFDHVFTMMENWLVHSVVE